MVRKKIWKSSLEVGREGAYETGVGRLLGGGPAGAEGGGGREGAKKMLLLLKRKPVGGNLLFEYML